MRTTISALLASLVMLGGLALFGVMAVGGF